MPNKKIKNMDKKKDVSKKHFDTRCGNCGKKLPYSEHKQYGFCGTCRVIIEHKKI